MSSHWGAIPDLTDEQVDMLPDDPVLASQAVALFEGMNSMADKAPDLRHPASTPVRNSPTQPVTKQFIASQSRAPRTVSRFQGFHGVLSQTQDESDPSVNISHNEGTRQESQLDLDSVTHLAGVSPRTPANLVARGRLAPTQSTQQTPSNTCEQDSDPDDFTEDMVVVNIDYELWIAADFQAAGESAAVTKKGKAESARVDPGGKLVTMQCLLFSDWSLADFKHKVMVWVRDHDKLAADHMETVEAKGDVLFWHVYIMQDRKYGKSANILLKTNDDFKSFAKAAIRANGKKIWVRVWMENIRQKAKKTDAQETVKKLLTMSYGKPEERSRLAQERLRMNINPRAAQGGVPAVMSRLMERSRKMSAAWGTEKQIWVNPVDPDQYFLTHNLALRWAQAIEDRDPGVSEDSPPKAAAYKYMARATLHGTPKTQRHIICVSSPSTGGGKRPRRHSGSVSSSNVPPLVAPTPIEDFLEYAQLTTDSETLAEVRAILRHHGIYFWSFFRDQSPQDLMDLGMKRGPAVILPQFVKGYEKKLKMEAMAQIRSV